MLRLIGNKISNEEGTKIFPTRQIPKAITNAAIKGKKNPIFPIVSIKRAPLPSGIGMPKKPVK